MQEKGNCNDYLGFKTDHRICYDDCITKEKLSEEIQVTTDLLV